MNNFLKDLGINFSKDPVSQKEAAARKQIKDSEQKRDALLDALDSTSSKIELQNKDFFEKIGRVIYDEKINLKDVGINNAEIETSIAEIKKNDEELKDIDSKRQNIIERYNEEIEILKSAIVEETPVDPNLNDETKNVTQVDEPGVVCQDCGNINPNGSIFCSKCGTKLVK